MEVAIINWELDWVLKSEFYCDKVLRPETTKLSATAVAEEATGSVDNICGEKICISQSPSSSYSFVRQTVRKITKEAHRSTIHVVA